MTKQSRNKKNVRRRAHASGKTLDAKTATQLNSSALRTSHADGLELSRPAKPVTARVPAAQRPVASITRVPQRSWVAKMRRRLDVLASAGGIWLREPRPAKRA